MLPKSILQRHSTREKMIKFMKRDYLTITNFHSLLSHAEMNETQTQNKNYIMLQGAMPPFNLHLLTTACKGTCLRRRNDILQKEQDENLLPRFDHRLSNLFWLQHHQGRSAISEKSEILNVNRNGPGFQTSY